MTTLALTHCRRRRVRRRAVIISGLAAATVLAYVTTLMVGNTFYSLGEVARVVFERGRRRGLVRGRRPAPAPARPWRCSRAPSFGLAGVTFQTMLRNPLAAPDIVGISAGAATAAVFGIVVLGLSESAVALLALVAALATAGAIYLLSHRNGFAGTRLILIGIGSGGDARQPHRLRAVEGIRVGHAGGDAVAHRQPQRGDLGHGCPAGPRPAPC